MALEIFGYTGIKVAAVIIEIANIGLINRVTVSLYKKLQTDKNWIYSRINFICSNAFNQKYFHHRFSNSGQ